MAGATVAPRLPRPITAFVSESGFPSSLELEDEEREEEREEEEEGEVEDDISSVAVWQIWHVKPCGLSIMKVTFGVGKKDSPSTDSSRSSLPSSRARVSRADRRKSRVTGPRYEGSP